MSNHPMSQGESWPEHVGSCYQRRMGWEESPLYWQQRKCGQGAATAGVEGACLPQLPIWKIGTTLRSLLISCFESSTLHNMNYVCTTHRLNEREELMTNSEMLAKSEALGMLLFVCFFRKQNPNQYVLIWLMKRVSMPTSATFPVSESLNSSVQDIHWQRQRGEHWGGNSSHGYSSCVKERPQGWWCLGWKLHLAAYILQ